MTQYSKYNENENIQVGDLVCFHPNTDLIKLAFNTFKHNCRQVIRSMCKN